MAVAESRFEGRDLSVVQHRDLRRLADYWLIKRTGRIMPTRGDIDPTDIPWALSRLYLVDYDLASSRFRYRKSKSRCRTSQPRSCRLAWWWRSSRCRSL